MINPNNFRPSAKLQVAKKETMMAVRWRVQLHSRHLEMGGQRWEHGEHVDADYLGMYGSCSLVFERCVKTQR